MELVGTVKEILPEQQISASFKKIELVIVTEDQYPQTIMIEFTQDKTMLLNNFAVGAKVKVSINIRGREWTNPQGEIKYFNSIQGWKIENEGEKAQQGQNYHPAPNHAQAQQIPMPSSPPLVDDSDLPF